MVSRNSIVPPTCEPSRFLLQILWDSSGSESILATIARRITTGSGNKIFFRPANNARVPGRGAMGGWDQVRARLIGDARAGDDGVLIDLPRHHPLVGAWCRSRWRSHSGRRGLGEAAK
jgi:hypothetical protein